jgi:hypothetical protein
VEKNMSNPIQDIQKQTYRYYYEDGLAELAVGILFSVIGLNLWLVSAAPKGTPLALAAWIALPILTIGGIFGVQYFVKKHKEIQVYPRTGYIAYDTQPNPYRWLIMGIPLLVVILAGIFPDSRLNRESVMGGILLCLVLVSIGVRVNLGRLIGIGILGLVLGITLAYMQVSEHVGLAITYTAAGLALLFSGGVAWRSYLSKNPFPGDDQEAANA